AMNTYTVTLKGPAPWGFRLQGGKDFSMPLTVSRLTPGGKAAQAGVGPGDWVVSIDHANAEEMTHVEAQNKIRAAGDTLTLSLSSQPKYSFAPSMSLNKMPRPFISGSDDTNLGPVTKPVTYVPTAPKFNAPANVLQQHNGSSSSTEWSSEEDGLLPRLSSSPPSLEWSRDLLISQIVVNLRLTSISHQLSCTSSPTASDRRHAHLIQPPTSQWLSSCSLDPLWVSPLSTVASYDCTQVKGSTAGAALKVTAPCCPGRTGSYFFLYFKNHVDIKANDSRHSLRVESVPCYLANDASKKRLIEDTQDWQPRTGTTQSRSFRILAQLTGTDFMQDPDDENLKKTRALAMPGSVTGIMSGLPVPSISSPERPQTEQRIHEMNQSPAKTGAVTTVGTTADKPGGGKEMGSVYPKNIGHIFCGNSNVACNSYSPLIRAGGKEMGVDNSSIATGASLARLRWVKGCRSARSAEMPEITKTTPRPAAGPSCRPPWVTDPNFADRYRPDKTSTVLTRHSQPAQPTPMQNRSSIVQAAQQAPDDSTRTPVCAACSKIIRGRYLVALGRSWHPEEFTCSQCKVVLEEGGFFEERGSILCTKCYDSRYAPNCAKCKKIITGEIMHALKMTWHVHCFICAACKIPIRNKAFYMEEGEPYCEKDYEKMFGTKCHGCDFKIDAGDRFLEALGYSWHDTCFVCAICQINLEGKTFYSKKDKPLCKTHAFSHV
ncbi:PDLI7 protein, partial [Atractosteus spatula]|nr:PDLI7 protein [Atractosteus spatula]